MKKLFVIPVAVLLTFLCTGSATVEANEFQRIIEEGETYINEAQTLFKYIEKLEEKIHEKPAFLKITKVRSKKITDTSAVISWKTNKKVTGEVVYWVGTSTPEETMKVSKSKKKKKHALKLKNLEPSTTYSYYVVSKKNRWIKAESPVKTFTTEPAPVVGDILATFTVATDGGRSDGNIPRPLDSTRAILAYGLQQGSDPENPYSMTASSSIGLEYRLEPGQTSTYDLNADNTPTFADFVNYMTNGTDESLSVGGTLHKSDGTLIIANVDDDPESSESRLSGSPDLQGATIHFIRFIITENTTYDDGDEGVGSIIAYTVEVWGAN